MKRFTVVYKEKGKKQEILMDFMADRLAPREVLQLKEYLRIGFMGNKIIFRNENNMELKVTDVVISTQDNKEEKPKKERKPKQSKEVKKEETNATFKPVSHKKEDLAKEA